MARIRKPDDAGQGPEDQLAGSPPASVDVGPEPGAGQPPQEHTEVIAADEHHAGHLRETVPSIFMFASLSQAFKVIDQHAYKVYRDDLLADCGSPTDPIEVMIVEQLALAHFSLGLLSCKAANAGKVEAVGVYAGAAARMMGEFRRSALALQVYRAASRQLAHDPTKDLLIPNEETDPIDDQSGESRINDELDVRTEESDAGETIIPYPEPTSLEGQSTRSTEKARDQPRGAGTTPRRRAGAKAVGALHRAAN
jgi:hypothetical protein